MRSLWLPAFVIFALSPMSQCGAAISLGDFSGGESIINFGTPATTQIVANPFTISGVTFQIGSGGFNVHIDDDSSLFSNIPGASLAGALETGLATAIVRIDFGAIPVNRAGLLASNVDGIATFELRAYDTSSVLLDSVDVTQAATAEAVFLGLQTTTNIAYLELQRVASTTFRHSNVIDDVRFEQAASVPEPASLVIWFAGVGCVLLVPRRRRQFSRRPAVAC